MATIDIRDEDQQIDTIVFASTDDVEQIVKSGRAIVFKDATGEYVMVRTQDVENLIKALQKAVELGWTK